VKTLEKMERMQNQPKATKDIPQAIASSVPFANTLGLDMGQPMVTPFGEETTGFPFFSLMVNPQEVTETSRKAANLLAQFGITKLGTKEKYIGDGTSEVFNDGKRYLLSQEQRGRVLRQIGQSFAAMINANADKLRRLEKTKGKDAVSDEIDSYAKKARSKVLFGMVPARK
jgi:arsenate reductase-like glutaredoxin family protein